jgi:tmRNA-binding protein
MKTELKTINLIEGQFSASQAADILNAMIDKKINYHKLQRMSITEGNNTDQCVHDSGRIDELLLEKAKIKEIIKEARSQGKTLKINSLINIEVV